MRSIKLRIIVRLAQRLRIFPSIIMSPCGAQHTVGDSVAGGFSNVYKCCGGIDNILRALKVPRLYTEHGLKVSLIS
jgi:hypothetical protein